MTWPTRGVTLRTRLLVLVVAVALPLLVLAAGALWQLGQSGWAQSEAALRVQVSGLASGIDHALERYQAILRTQAASSALAHGELADFATELRATAAELPGSVFILVDAASGQRLLREGAPVTGLPPSAWPPPRPVPDPVYAGNRLVSDLHPGTLTGLPTLSMEVPAVIGSDGNARYSLRLKLPVPALLVLLHVTSVPAAPGNFMTAMLTDRSGAVIAEATVHDPAAGQALAWADVPRADAPLPATLRQAMRRQDSGVLGASFLADPASVYAFSRAPQSGFGAILSMPAEHFLAPIRTAMATTLAVGAVLLAAGLCGGILMSRNIVSSLGRLAAHGGHTGVPEIDRLAGSLVIASAALSNREKRLRLAVEAAGLATWDLDVVTGESVWSRELFQLLGLPPNPSGHASVDTLSALLDPADQPRVAALRATAIRDRTPYHTDYRVHRADDGSERWLEAFGHYTEVDGKPRMLGVLADITERRTQEVAIRSLNAQLAEAVRTRSAELAATDARLRGFWDNSPESLFMIRVTPEGDYVFAGQNPSHAALTGSAGESRVGRKPLAHFPRAQAELLFARYGECVQCGQPMRYSTTLDYPTGQRDIETILVPIRDVPDGPVTLLLGSVRDMTERNRLQAQLAQAQKMQALGQLAGGIAHDINNVLQAVLGGAGLIAARPHEPTRVARLVRGIIDAAERGASVTQRLLAFSRRGELQAIALDPVAVLNGLHDVLVHALGPTISVQVQAMPGLPPMLADKGQLETVLLNLATNARDAMPGGGVLILSAMLEEVTEASTSVPPDSWRAGLTPPMGLAPGWYVRLTAEDTGTGMDEATLARVTEPFFTTKRVGEGTGLGLAMARGFAEQSGGGIAVGSVPGRGTVISLWLPRATGPVVEIAPRVNRMAGCRVMMVDDDALVRETLSAQLQSAGFEVTCFADGETALAALSVAPPDDATPDWLPTDLLLTDLTMPGLDGVALIHAARERHATLPAILLTGRADDRAGLDALTAVRLVRKPVGLDRLIEVIAALLVPPGVAAPLPAAPAMLIGARP